MKPIQRRFMRPESCCGGIPRRAFLADLGFGVTGLALGALLNGDNILRASEAPLAGTTLGQPHFKPKAKNVIWIFLSGGYSHLETFDPKLSLNLYDGKTYDKTPYNDPFQNPFYAERSRSVVGGARKIFPSIMRLQVGYRKRGQSGVEMSDWLPHLAECVDDIALIRSMYTTDNDHAAQQQFHNGRHRLDDPQPSVGSWITYGLGSMNENLPQFVVLGDASDGRVKPDFGGNYLGPQYSGVELAMDPNQPLAFGHRPEGISAEEQKNEFDYIDKINRLAAVEYPDDQQLAARIRSYELAFRMQTAVPETVQFADETEETLELYGVGKEPTDTVARLMLSARRFAERGVRFTLVYPSPYSAWDSHTKLQQNHSKLCRQIDQPVAGLLKDLKRRGMWDDTVVVFCTEFGRTPGLEVLNGEMTGRDHHPHGFSIWLAGAGIKRGVVHGKTDELGFHAVEDAHYVTDIHATVLHLLGLDSRLLNIPGRKRLEIDYGKVISPILA